MAYTIPDPDVVVDPALIHGQYQKGSLLLQASFDREEWVTLKTVVVPDHTAGKAFFRLAGFPYPFLRAVYENVLTDTGSISLTMTAKGN
jgi:hypothetical protein